MAEKKAKEKKIKKKPPKAVKKQILKKPLKKQAKPPVKEEFAPSANLLRWQAPDYYTFEKSPYWSLGVGIIAIAASLVLIYTQNYFPVMIVILAVIVTFQVAHEKPKSHEFAIDESGVLSRNTYIPFIELRSFWIAKHGTKSVLYLEPVSHLKGPVVIPLGNQGAAEVKNFILRYLPEKMEYGEMLSEKLIRIFRL